MAWSSIILLMSFVWAIFLWLKNPVIIDVFWSIAITIAALHFSSFENSNTVKLILQILLIIWASRLAGYLFFKRILPRKIDQRYNEISQQWKVSKSIGFFFNFQFQGILAVFIAIPFIIIVTTFAF